MTTYQVRNGNGPVVKVELPGSVNDYSLGELLAAAAEQTGFTISVGDQQILEVTPGQGHTLVDDVEAHVAQPEPTQYVSNERASNA